MTALDHNRAKSAFAAKAGVSAGAVSHMAIWGNHSSTMYPDYRNALVVFSYPVVSDGVSHRIVEGVRHGPEAQAALKATADELAAEREAVRDLAPR